MNDEQMKRALKAADLIAYGTIGVSTEAEMFLADALLASQAEVEKLQSLLSEKERAHGVTRDLWKKDKGKLAKAMDVLYGHKCLSGGNAYTDACYFCREIKKLEEGK